MKLRLTVCVLVSLALMSCALDGRRSTIAELDNISIEIEDVHIEDGLDKAMQGYQKYLKETTETALTPEAMRRVADLKIEKEYGVIASARQQDSDKVDTAPVRVNSSKPAGTEKAANRESISAGETTPRGGISQNAGGAAKGAATLTSSMENQVSSTGTARQHPALNEPPMVTAGAADGGRDDKAGKALEAIALYKELLKRYPMYERNDQVLYQLSRAYEEIGQVDNAMKVMNRLVREFPASRYTDEVQFRRGEYFFTRKKYLEAEDAYGEVLKLGKRSVYYERALYKKGWTFYKQELYEDALHQFFALLDYKNSIGFDLERSGEDIETKRVTDTFRVVSLAFSNLGGARTVREYFTAQGARSYEDTVYSHLAEFYLAKQRYSDAATTYDTFIETNPFHEKSPQFSMRVIHIYGKGGFPRLVISAKKEFVTTYGRDAQYWNYHEQSERPETLGYLKENLKDLANYYHAAYQSEKLKQDKETNFSEASRWYRDYLKSFSNDAEAAGLNYQFSELLLENQNYLEAAAEYERSAYDYPVFERSHDAAYAAVYSLREYLKAPDTEHTDEIKKEIIRVSLRLVNTYPVHGKAPVVLGAVVEDAYKLEDYALAADLGRRLVKDYEAADAGIRRGAWLVIAHSSYEIEKYHDAESAYIKTLDLTPEGDPRQAKLMDNLAASVYKQGEKARSRENYEVAVGHFLRIAELAPTSEIRPAAEYDAAAVLIKIMDLRRAAEVLTAFRENFPGHELQHDVTKKMAFVYRELKEFSRAAREYERVAEEAAEEELVREAMYTAGDLYERAKDIENALRTYEQYAQKFPKPLEVALETYYKIAMIHKSQSEPARYRNTLQHIIDADAKAGEKRTDRTRYLAAQASLEVIKPEYEQFLDIKLVEPFKDTLATKQKAMKRLVKGYTDLVEYQVADVTAASTYYIAEIYYNFSRSLMESERPEGLNALELEEFNLMVEEQAYPFEEKSIAVHEKNVERLRAGVYSIWIDRSIEQLAILVPASYRKPEESTNYVTEIDHFTYSAPGALREEASTGYITNLPIFRYPSEKRNYVNQVGNPGADISMRQGGAGDPRPSERLALGGKS